MALGEQASLSLAESWDSLIIGNFGTVLERWAIKMTTVYGGEARGKNMTA